MAIRGIQSDILRESRDVWPIITTYLDIDTTKSLRLTCKELSQLPIASKIRWDLTRMKSRFSAPSIIQSARCEASSAILRLNSFSNLSDLCIFAEDGTLAVSEVDLVAALCALPSLRHLELSRINNLRSLHQLTQLTSFRSKDCPLLLPSSLADLTALTGLDLSSSPPVSNLSHFTRLTGLRSLSVWGVPEEVSFSHFPSLTELNCSYCVVRDGCFDGLYQLTSLDCTGCDGLTDACLRDLTALTSCLVRTSILQAGTDSIISRLTALRSIRGMLALGNLTRLCSLSELELTYGCTANLVHRFAASALLNR